MLFSVAIAYHYLEEGILMLLRGFMATLNADFENLLWIDSSFSGGI